MNGETLKVTLLAAILVVQTLALIGRPANNVADVPPAAADGLMDVRIVAIDLDSNSLTQADALPVKTYENLFVCLGERSLNPLSSGVECAEDSPVIP